MAETNIEKAAYWLYIDPTGGTNYSNLVCLTDFTYNLSNNSTTRDTICGPKSNPGSQTQSVSLNGEIIRDPDTGNLSAQDVFTLGQNATTFGWKIAPAVPQAGDITKTGQGFFSAYTETYSGADVAKFTGTISVNGLTAQTITPGT